VPLKAIFAGIPSQKAYSASGRTGRGHTLPAQETASLPAETFTIMGKAISHGVIRRITE
jgi:hypothetical protein